MNVLGHLSFNQLLSQVLFRFRNETFLIFEDEYTTFHNFERKLLQVHRFLKKHNIRHNDVVTIVSDNCTELVVQLYGIITYGAVANPLNPKLLPAEIINIVEHADSKLMVTDIDMGWLESRHSLRVVSMNQYESMDERDETDMEQLAPVHSGGLLIYTSGTTGEPKGVLLDKENLLANITTAIEKYELDSDHTKLCFLPLYHTFAYISDVSTMLFSGGKVVLIETFSPIKVKDIERNIQKYAVNSFSAVPLIFSTLIRLSANLRQPSMKFCISGAAPLHATIVEQFLELYGFPILPAYGLTEGTCFCTISSKEQSRHGSIGKPANISIKVISENEEELGHNTIGELLIKGESVIQHGYYKNDIACYSSKFPQWFRTGDLGWFDEDGFYYIAGRKKNMVIRGGEKIYLEEIDFVLSQLAGIKDHATIRIGEREIDEMVCCLVPEDSSLISEREAKQFLVEKLGRLKCPDSIVFVANIPRTPTNKVKIGELQKLVASGGFHDH